MHLLEDKVAIITGGAGGIGSAIARRFLSEGARVVIADVNDEAGAAAVKEMGALGKDLGALGSVRYVRCDIGDSGSVRNLLDATIAAFGPVDILVNNAAVLAARDFLDLEEAEFDRVIRVNLKGSFLVGQAVARHMVERIKAGGKPGAIINLSSVNAVFAIANQVPYSVSKGGINQLTKVMALSLAEHGIRVNAIGPGSINTEMLKATMADAAARGRILSQTPMGRIGEPSEIASIAVFLASDEASYITGQTIYADGGRLPLNYTVPVKG